MPDQLANTIRIESRIRVFPEFPSNDPNCTPLSILDATVARFSPTAAIWMYNQSLPIENIVISLRRTLNAYPQWAGQLEWTEFDPKGDHTQRHGRLRLSFGTRADPGVECIIAHSTHRISDIVPAQASDLWDAGVFPGNDLLDTTISLALHNLVDFKGLPCMIVQITKFGGGGFAIAVKLAHPLADAQSLVQFVRDWAAVDCAAVAGLPPPVLSPVFNPQLLDGAAAGDIDSNRPELEILEQARALPLHRYDWWASGNRCPHPIISATRIPQGLSSEVIGPLGKPMPWDDWDLSFPVARYTLRFNAEELRAMWEDASSSARVSHLDALLAHIWTLISRARGLAHDEEHYLDVTFGFRSRLNPPLPETFLGSPLTLARVASTGGDASNHAVGTMAASIRSALAQFNANTLPALLHDMAYEASAQRLWNAFLGRHNTIVTSWLSLGIHDIDFGTGPPVHVDAVMPSADGCVQVMEPGHIQEKMEGGEGRKWYEEGVCISLYLREDVMRKVLEDPLLRKYRTSL